MTDQEIQILADACRMAGIDATKIKPENPFEKSGSTATFIQGAVEQIDPVMAAKWRVAAGGGRGEGTGPHDHDHGEVVVEFSAKRPAKLKTLDADALLLLMTDC